MTYSSIKILMFIFVYVHLHECDDLSWLETNILVTKIVPPPPHTKNPNSALGDFGLMISACSSSDWFIQWHLDLNLKETGLVRWYGFAINNDNPTNSTSNISTHFFIDKFERKSPYLHPYKDVWEVNRECRHPLFPIAGVIRGGCQNSMDHYS